MKKNLKLSKGWGVKDVKEVKNEELKDEIVASMDEEKEEKKKVEKKRKIDNKSVYASGEYIKTKWGWKREGETDDDGYPIIRKESETFIFIFKN